MPGVLNSNMWLYNEEKSKGEKVLFLGDVNSNCLIAGLT